jgi:hypothetical protein
MASRALWIALLQFEHGACPRNDVLIIHAYNIMHIFYGCSLAIFLTDRTPGLTPGYAMQGPALTAPWIYNVKEFTTFYCKGTRGHVPKNAEGQGKYEGMQ